MLVQKLWLRQFRNIENLSFEPHPSLNFLIGKNGQGKTSILEALGYLSLLRSFRSSRNDALIRDEQAESEIGCELSTKDEGDAVWETELKVQLHRGIQNRVRRRAWINDRAYASSTQYLSQKFKDSSYAHACGMHVIVFNPSDHDLIQGEPKNRRKYLDQTLASQSKTYLLALKRYEKILDQRNAYLKGLEGRFPRDTTLYQGLTEQLGQEAAKLTSARLNHLQKIHERHPQVMSKIAPNQKPLHCVYQSQWVRRDHNSSNKNRDLSTIHFTGQGSLPSIEQLLSDFLTACESLRFAEVQLGRTLVGPQRDDWGFWFGKPLSHQPLKAYGSQGEIRSSLLSLKLTEIQLYREATGLRPLLLLDDFSSELDDHRRAQLLELLLETDLQVFVTSTDPVMETLSAVRSDALSESLKSGFLSWDIENGIVSKRKSNQLSKGLRLRTKETNDVILNPSSKRESLS